MKSEKEKMLSGELYNPLDPQLCRERDRCRDLCLLLNATREDQKEERRRLLVELFGKETESGFSRLFSATTARTSPWALKFSSTSIAWCSTSHR
jgi:hypothetical protein